ncbi:catabolite repression HPr-like protein [Lachnospiraceae bacterium NE2001]|nr:catabolite repression HPr-like protein [Lachnospiraceae bacterium NE2001]
MANKKFTVNIPEFDEARPVAEIVQTASQFESSIYLVSGTKRINAKSIMGMMSLGLCNNEEIEIDADGPDENEAINAIINYMNPECKSE